MKTLLLIDAHSIIHRAYHALPSLTAENNMPTGALYGVACILLRTLAEKKPDYVAAAFDRPEPTFRKKEFPEYKAHRPPTDQELVVQLIEARNLFKSFGISVCEVPGFEADDIIGTLAEKFSKDVRVLILTGDLDSLQLVSKNIAVEMFKKGISETKTYDRDAIIERLGILPEQVPDLKGLAGDSSDNIPGVKGVGPKTAALLLNRFKTLEDFFQSNDTEKKFESIRKNKEIALLSKKLATIRRDVPVSATLENLTVKKDEKIFSEYIKKLGFSSILKNKNSAHVSETLEAKGTQTTLNNVYFQPKKIDGVLVGKNIKDFIKSGKKEKNIFDIDVALWLINPEKTALVNEYTDPENAYSTLKKTLQERGMWGVFEEIEMPIISALADMEKTGICVDKKALLSLQKELLKDTAQIEKEIYERRNVFLFVTRRILYFP